MLCHHTQYIYFFVLGDSDNIKVEIIVLRRIFFRNLCVFDDLFFRVLQILLYPAKAYHSQTKNIKVIFDFGGRFFATFKKKKDAEKNEKLITMR